jgi:hypothetical protein
VIELSFRDSPGSNTMVLPVPQAVNAKLTAQNNAHSAKHRVFMSSTPYFLIGCAASVARIGIFAATRLFFNADYRHQWSTLPPVINVAPTPRTAA